MPGKIGTAGIQFQWRLRHKTAFVPYEGSWRFDELRAVRKAKLARLNIPDIPNVIPLEVYDGVDLIDCDDGGIIVRLSTVRLPEEETP
jgi:hypothetical protein